MENQERSIKTKEEKEEIWKRKRKTDENDERNKRETK